MTAPLRRVFVRRPGAVDRWREYGWRAAPDPVRIVEEHESFVAALEAAGAEVVIGEPLDSALDAIYVHDPAAVTSRGAVLLRPGKELRQVEVDAIERDFTAAGIDVLARLEAPATAEGGDMLWLDERTLVLGRGYRTNDSRRRGATRGAPRRRGARRGPAALPRPRRGDAPALAHLAARGRPRGRLPAAACRCGWSSCSRQRGVGFVEVPDEEFESMACNVLALAPRVALTLDGNPETRRRLEAAGVDVRVYPGEELSRKGDGGPTCLTRPLVRG